MENNEKQNKPWDVTPERLAFLIEQNEDKFATWKPPSKIEAIEAALAGWHPSKKRRGYGHCGCSVYFSGCDNCPMVGGCIDDVHDIWIECNSGSEDEDKAAEAVYQFILSKYWEEKERLGND